MFIWRRVLFVSFALFGAWGFGACGKSTLRCASDGDCAGGMLCDAQKVCRPRCTGAGDCSNGARCVSGLCQSSEPGTFEPPGADGGPVEGATERAIPERGQPENNTPRGDDKIGPSPQCSASTRACYTGPDGTQDKGACKAGKQRCIDGQWGPCVGEVKPKQELCNGVDDDCDGKVNATCPVWLTSAGGKSGDDGNGIALGPSGEIIITGSFGQDATFGASTLSSQGGTDAFVAKLDSTGKVLWAQAIGASGDDSGEAVATDASGNVHVTGTFEGSITLGTTQLTSKGGKNIYVAKLDPAGRTIWAVSAGGATGGIEAHALSVDKAGNVYLTGSFAESASLGATSLKARGKLDVFAAKMDPSGKFLWAVSAGGEDSEEGLAITTDASNNVYISGYLQGNATFGGRTIASDFYTNFFATKLSPTGAFLWTSAGSRSWYANANGIQVDSTGNVYIAGTFEGELQFGGKTLSADLGTEVYVAKLNASGTLVWIVSASGYENIPGKGLGLDSAGNLYLFGSFIDRVSFGSSSLSASDGADLFVTKLSNAGQFVSAISLGGKETHTAGALAVDSSGKAHIIGNFRGNISFGSSSLDAKGYTDIIVAKVSLP